MLWAIAHYSGVAIHPYLIGMAIRWAAIAGVLRLRVCRAARSRMDFRGMLVGAKLVMTWKLLPGRRHLQVLSSIFLRLIKTIVAPLIFSTLVVGIAGHSNLKQVGRMGIKALLYFEIVTTIALFIGLAAINISRRGVGVHAAAQLPRRTVSAPPQKAPTLSCIFFRRTSPSRWLKAGACRWWYSA